MQFRNIFFITLLPGILSAAVFTVMVTERRRRLNQRIRFWGTVRSLPKGYRRFLVAVGVFGHGDFAPTLLVLAATQSMTPAHGIVHAAHLAGLMYVVRNVVCALASYPIGALSDRIDRSKILAFGYVTAVFTTCGVIVGLAFQMADPV